MRPDGSADVRTGSAPSQLRRRCAPRVTVLSGDACGALELALDAVTWPPAPLILAAALALPASLEVAVALLTSEPAGASASTRARSESVSEPVRSPTIQQALPSCSVAVPSDDVGHVVGQLVADDDAVRGSARGLDDELVADASRPRPRSWRAPACAARSPAASDGVDGVDADERAPAGGATGTAGGTTGRRRRRHDRRAPAAVRRAAAAGAAAAAAAAAAAEAAGAAASGFGHLQRDGLDRRRRSTSLPRPACRRGPATCA